MADKMAKKAALEGEERILQLVDLGERKKDNEEVFSELKEKELQKIGGTKNEKGEWLLPGRRQVLNKALARKVLENIRTSTQWGTQVFCGHFLRAYACIEVFEIA